MPVLTDVDLDKPNNFTLLRERGNYLCKMFYVFNDDRDIPTQEYIIRIKKARIFDYDKKIINITFSINDEINKKIYEFITALEENIGIAINMKTRKSNFSCVKKMVTLCAYSNEMIVFGEDNTILENYSLTFNTNISVVIKLSQINCEGNKYVPNWDAVQLKINKNLEKKCMFDEIMNDKITNNNITNEVVTKNIVTPKYQIPKPPPLRINHFAPNVGDIVDMKNKLKKVKRIKKMI